MTPERTDLDAILDLFFPNGARSRTELPYGFCDTIQMGFLEFTVTVYQKAHHRKPAESVVVAIQGLRVTDGSHPTLWFKMSDASSPGELKEAVREGHKVLMGVTVAVLMATGDEPEVTHPQRRSAKTANFAKAFSDPAFDIETLIKRIEGKL